MTKITAASDSTFNHGGVDFKIDEKGTLWVDGGEWDDDIIREIEEFENTDRYDDEVEFELTDDDVAKARDYLQQKQDAYELDFVADALIGKLGTSQDYQWLHEEVVDLDTLIDEQVAEYVKGQASNVFSYNVTVEFEEKYGREMNMTFDEFLKASDYEDALKAVLMARDAARDNITLESVMTPKEAAEEFGIKEDTVRDAIEHEWLIARKSGATWLFLRKHAQKRWAKK